MIKLKALLLLSLCEAPCAFSTMTVDLLPSQVPPQPVGTVITWTAEVHGADSADLAYRFRVRRAGLRFRMAVDYGPANTFDWTSAEEDGAFEIEVTALSLKSREAAVKTVPYKLETRATGDRPNIALTGHPLVLLYSAPPCDEPGRMKVRYQSSEGVRAETPYKYCRSGSSMNFYLAGLLPAMEYFAYHTIDTGDAFEDGPVVAEFTGTIPELPESQVLKPAPPGSPYPVVLQQNVFTNPVAVDLQGRIVWYLTTVPDFPTRPDTGGYFFGIVQARNSDRRHRFLRLFDLTGRVVLETNVARLNEQLAATGKAPINSFHHEALRLPEGRIAVLAGIEKIVTDQQGAGNVHVLGDGILVLDEDLNVVWTWNSFDHLDIRRLATIGDMCLAGGCPPTDLGANPNDWTHANSISQAPDGNLLVSLRSQDWVIKIDYRNGEGDGHVIWRLGKDGDFRLAGAGPSGWFTHQHDARFEPRSATRLMIFDNANTRHDSDAQALSRGQVYEIDEQNRSAALVLNADMPYSLALGSTQRLPNGNYQFVSGFLPDASGTSMEIDAQGKPVFVINTRAPVYRSYRLPNLYSEVP
jgi:hypothetical protein